MGKRIYCKKSIRVVSEDSIDIWLCMGVRVHSLLTKKKGLVFYTIFFLDFIPFLQDSDFLAGPQTYKIFTSNLLQLFELIDGLIVCIRKKNAIFFFPKDLNSLAVNELINTMSSDFRFRSYNPRSFTFFFRSLALHLVTVGVFFGYYTRGTTPPIILTSFIFFILVGGITSLLSNHCTSRRLLIMVLKTLIVQITC